MPAACAVERNRWSPLVSQAPLDGTREALSSQSESFTFAKIIHPLMKRINVRHQQAPASARQLRNFVRRGVLAALLLAGWSVGHPSARAASPYQNAARAPLAELNNKNGLAMKGYDVVDYVSQRKPVHGA